MELVLVSLAGKNKTNYLDAIEKTIASYFRWKMTKRNHLSESRTEETTIDLLRIQGWRTERLPKGAIIRKNEYKNHIVLAEIFKGRSKTGKGDGYPDFLIVDPLSMRPLAVIEAKADAGQIGLALAEAKIYASACIEAGHDVIAIGIAGQERTEIKISVNKHHKSQWRDVCYNEKPISWIPTPINVINLLQIPTLLDLSPVVPSNEVLAEKADKINRILREAAIKDEYRPAYVGAMMLALWQSNGRVRKDSEFILGDVNTACQKAFLAARKVELGKSLQINEANIKLAETGWQILSILEKLNVVNAAFDHDYLGQLYETFFRYTGGNTIGQYFTPRHIARFMADLCEVTKDDVVIDPACGTGGFLISVIQRACEFDNAKYEDVVEMVRKNLIGYESEPLTAALCVANMILRGDGKSGIHGEDVFHASDFPAGKCDVALMNPPFPHKSTDIPPQHFIERALEALKKRGKLAVIIPTSLIVKREYAEWRNTVLASHSLLAVVELPDEVFQPYASTTTSVLVLEKGIPHNEKLRTTFVHLKYDGLNLKKGVRVARRDGKNRIPNAVEAVLNKSDVPGFSGNAIIGSGMEWAPGAYIPSGIPEITELRSSVDELFRRYVSFFTRYAAEVSMQRKLITSGELAASPYRDIITSARIKNAETSKAKNNTIGYYFDVVYGQKELHSRDGIPPGDSLIISPTEKYNGTYGWLKFDNLIQPSFITVAQTGSIGEAFVQTEPCGVNDDCLILLPKIGLDIPESMLFIAAATIRLERWRFSYGRKLTALCRFVWNLTPTAILGNAVRA
ncbi:type I restriction enzyme M protein [Oxalobacteraceae bacterium GrIS 1.11]